MVNVNKTTQLSPHHRQCIKHHTPHINPCTFRIFCIKHEIYCLLQNLNIHQLIYKMQACLFPPTWNKHYNVFYTKMTDRKPNVHFFCWTGFPLSLLKLLPVILKKLRTFYYLKIKMLLIHYILYHLLDAKKSVYIMKGGVQKNPNENKWISSNKRNVSDSPVGLAWSGRSSGPAASGPWRQGCGWWQSRTSWSAAGGAWRKSASVWSSGWSCTGSPGPWTHRRSHCSSELQGTAGGKVKTMVSVCFPKRWLKFHRIQLKIHSFSLALMKYLPTNLLFIHLKV